MNKLRESRHTITITKHGYYCHTKTTIIITYKLKVGY